MKGITEKISLIIIIMLIMSMVTLPQKCAAYQQHGADSAESLLAEAGITVNVIPLEYPEGFTIGFVINGPSDSRIVIGFPGQEQTGNAFFISIDGKELVVPLSDNSAAVIAQQAGNYILLFLCVIEAALILVEDIELCADDDPLCFVTNLISFVATAMNCREQYGS